MSKKIQFSLVTVLVLFGVWFYFTPHLALHSIKSAVEAQDAGKFSSYVDFPALKENLKASLSARLQEKMAEKQLDNPYAALGAAMVAAFINPMVDAIVTPESLAKLMQGQLPGDNTKRENLASDKSQLEPAVKISTSYEGFDRFVVTVKKNREGSEPIDFVLSRDGMFSWKLSEIRLPF